ncbi:MAG: electron transfer flavoprotein subunit beta/FixA family protein [Oligoflexia bacterium]|nr:electron transfer flavoprotein subunit beta/FixA family protein [Oligoflexia bacterium]
MRIYVCVKHVPDTAAKIVVRNKTEIDESVKFVINPYDEYALEEALRLKEKFSGEVIVVMLGKVSSMATLRLALAMGADRGILVKCDQHLDHQTISKTLAKTISNDGKADIIFMGKQSVDAEGMQTPYLLAKNLDMPISTNVLSFSSDGTSSVIVESEGEGGLRTVIQMKLPCVVAAAKGLNHPRYPKLPDIMKAKTKPVKEIPFADLAINPIASDHVASLLELELPPEKGQGIIYSGRAAKDMVANLVSDLQNKAQVI